MKHTLVGLLLALACGSDTPPPKDNGVVPTSGHAVNAAPVWSTMNGAFTDTADCDNADFKRITLPWIVSCGWTCVYYQNVSDTNLQVTMVQDATDGKWHTAQEQSTLLGDGACNN